jgi:hypothetical protein
MHRAASGRERCVVDLRGGIAAQPRRPARIDRYADGLECLRGCRVDKCLANVEARRIDGEHGEIGRDRVTAARVGLLGPQGGRHPFDSVARFELAQCLHATAHPRKAVGLVDLCEWRHGILRGSQQFCAGLAQPGSALFG